MANTNKPIGFKVRDVEAEKPIKMLLVNGVVATKGDVVYVASSGLIQLTRVAGYIAGVMASPMYNGLTGELVTTAVSARGDYAMVYADPNAVFVGQETAYALTDPYTTHTSASAFDIAGTTGVQYIDAGASTNDEVQIIGVEPDFGRADAPISEVGAYAKVSFKFNLAKHAFGISA